MAASEIVTDPQLTSVLRAAEQARAQCDEILSLMTAQRDQGESHERATQQKKLFADLAKLRGLNRKAILDVRRTKQDTADARQEVDTLHLQLQNLYYEQRHLNGEIALCETYDHPYKKLPLVDVPTYLSLHPDHMDLDEHELMRERLEHEHAERLHLEEARQALLKQKQSLISENNKRKEVLAALDKKLDDWIDGSDSIDKDFRTCDEELGKVGAAATPAKVHEVTVVSET